MPILHLLTLEPSTPLSRFVSGIINSPKPFFALRENWPHPPLYPAQYLWGCRILVLWPSPPPFLLNCVTVTKQVLNVYWWTTCIHLAQSPFWPLSCHTLIHAYRDSFKTMWVSTKDQASIWSHFMAKTSGFTVKFMKFNFQDPSLAPSKALNLFLCFGIFIS